MSEVSFFVNGVEHTLRLQPNETLLEVLRERLGLMGAKRGCDEGVCGACTVIIDGQTELSCMKLAVRCGGTHIVTVEGLANGAELHPLQQAALDHGAVQCGFCTPGWLLSAKVLLDHNPTPSSAEVREAIAGNLCRCTGYQKIHQAIQSVATGD